MRPRTSPPFWLLLLCLGSLACGPTLATVRVPGEAPYAAAVRESLAARADSIQTCVSSASFHYPAKQPLSSATLVVVDAPASFETRSLHPFLLDVEICLGRSLLDWKPPPAPAGRMVTVRFHFRPEGTELAQAEVPRHPFFDVYGLWLDLEVQEVALRPYQRAVAVWEDRTMSAPVLESEGPAAPLPPALRARLAGKLYVALCTLTHEGHVQDCELVKEKDPEVVRAVTQRLQSRHYKPAIYKGARVTVAYPFQVGFKGP